MNKFVFNHRLVLTGLALTVMSSCSMLKFSILKDSTQKEGITPAKPNLELLIQTPKNNYDALLLSTISKFKPVLKDFPRHLGVVGGDTLDLSYEKPESIDSSMIAHNIIVRNNALRHLPKSKPYLGMIFQACDDYRTIFRVPSETIIALFAQESSFNPYAISTAFAFGMGQFMLETAEDFGVPTYSKEKYPMLYKYEKGLAAINKQYLAAERLGIRSHHNNDFEAAKMYELKADSIADLRSELLNKLENELRSIDIKKLNDGRLVPSIIIPVAVRYVAILARMCKTQYHCSDEQALDWATEAYNAGLGSIEYNFPALETSGHSRGIDKIEAKLFPHR